MVERILTGTLLVTGSLAALFLLPFPFFLLLVDIALLLGFLELKKITANNGISCFWISLPFLLALPWIWNYCAELIIPALSLALLVHVFWSVIRPNENLQKSLSTTAASLFSVLYLGIPFSLLSTYQVNAPASASDPARIHELMLVFIILWISDTAAYFTGRAIGRHKVTPRISPNKSLEGFIAGIFFPAPAAAVYGYYLLPEFSLWFLVLAGTVVAISGIIGDLFESSIKRGSGIKDSSKLFPGHGGMLDRTDSFLTGMPVYYLLLLGWSSLNF